MRRVMITGVSSGTGKTTVTCAVLGALKKRGLIPAAFKCGPDYIDPMFHSEVTGVKSRNLDGFFMDKETMKYLLWENSKGTDISVLEGAMGYYDGAGFTDNASAYSIARDTKTPVILVIDASGIGLSVGAVIKGCMEFRRDSGICGVIFNKVSPMVYPKMAETARSIGVTPLGYIPKNSEFSLESRHLGLVTAKEVCGIKEKLDMMASLDTIDIDGILKLSEAEDIRAKEPDFQNIGHGVKIAVAKDKAFCFYYQDNLDYLKRCGCELVEFSPLNDKRLPEDISGLILGGGYPELYLEKLSENTSMRESVKRKVDEGLPTAAECGGFMYLHKSIEGIPMAGVIDAEAYNAGRLVRFGYIRLTALKDTMYCRKGESIPAHEFHYWDSSENGDAFLAEKPYSKKSWKGGISKGNLAAGFAHIHYYGNTNFADNFIRSAVKWKDSIKTQ